MVDHSRSAPMRRVARIEANVPWIAIMTSPQRMLLSIVDQCLVSGTNFLTIVIVGRACGLHELGIYSLAFTVVVTLLAMQESLLIAPYTVIMSRLRKAARREDYGAATLWQQLVIAVAVSIVFLLSSCGALAFGSDYSKLLCVLSAAAPCWLIKEFARRAAFVELNIRPPLVLDAAAASVQLGFLGVWWLRGELSAAGALTAAGLGHAAAIALWWFAFRPIFHWRPVLLRRALALNWAFGSWSCIGRLTDMMHAYSLHWLLALVSGPAATGAFAAASSLLALSNPVLMGIGNLLAPETARAYAAGGLAALRRVVLRATCIVTLVTAFFVLFLVGGAELLLQVTFGEIQDGQVVVVTILAFGMLASITGFGSDNGLRALARPAESFRASLVGLVVSVIVGSMLIGQLDAIGAAIGALVGDLTSTLIRIGAFCRIVQARTRSSRALAFEVGP